MVLKCLWHVTPIFRCYTIPLLVSYSVETLKLEQLEHPEMEHSLQKLTLKTIPELTSEIMAAILTKFPQLKVLILDVKVVARTSSIADLLAARPEMLILLNERLYFNSSLMASKWSQLIRRFDLREKLIYENRGAIKSFVGVTPHSSGIPFLNSFSNCAC